MDVLPTGTVTFLAIQLGYTAADLEQHDTGLDEVLDRYDGMVRVGVEAHGGVVFRLQGSTLYTCFATAPAAINAALHVLHLLRNEAVASPGSWSVKMALHTGTAQPRRGDYRGLARRNVDHVLAVAQPWQVLLTTVTAELARDQLPDAAALRDLGMHGVSGLPRAERLYQLTAPDLPTEFAPLPTSLTRFSSGHGEITRLVNREQQLAATRQLLLLQDVRLVTLTGPGGIGKTRVATRVAAEVIQHFSDGVYFVPLASLSNPDHVAPAIGEALGLLDGGSQPQFDRTKHFLGQKRVLLVLDNFEHLLPAALMVVDLLSSCPGLTVLTTSRAVLGVYGEHIIPIPPMTLPATNQRLTPADLAQYGSITLFIERATAASPSFQITEVNLPVVVEICRRLEGIPLAIELAANWVSVLSPEGIREGLSSRLHFLTRGPHDFPLRHQTLRQVLDWSYDLLTPEGQTLLARLGVFRGTWTVEAAEAVCNADRALSFPVFEGLISLQDKSLLYSTRADENGTRFWMLDTIREYAEQQLREHGEVVILRSYHAHHYLKLAETVDSELVGSTQTRWLSILETEHDNLRAAIDTFLERGEPEFAVRITTALGRFWWMRGHLTEGRRWLNQALAQSGELSHNVRAKALYWSAILAMQQGEYAIAEGAISESYQLYTESRDTYGIGLAFNAMGSLANRWQRHGEARMHYEESLTIFRELGVTERIAALLNNLGFTHLIEGSLAAAQQLLEESLRLSEQLEDRQGIAFAFSNLGLVAARNGNFEQALRHFIDSLTIFEALGDKRNCAECLEGAAQVLFTRGHVELAVRLLSSARTIREIIGTPSPPHEQAQLEPIVTAARAALGESTFRAASEAGRGTTPKEAVALLAAVVTSTPSTKVAHPEARRDPHQRTPRAAIAGLTAREVEVLHLVAQGLTDAEVGEHLAISARTVGKHLTSIYSKLGLSSRTAATRYAVDHKLV